MTTETKGKGETLAGLLFSGPFPYGNVFQTVWKSWTEDTDDKLESRQLSDKLESRKRPVALTVFRSPVLE